ncbi:MAG: hypothetical protein MAG715_00406 [Methanonatronarchaeales archaeon]|nr:hypothetical protein [Methanonatronarchaeales archaeon]
MIRVKRVYEEPSPDDGYRVLVDRLWPRGLSREDAALDDWPKEVAPSDELRRLLHEEGDWHGFSSGYRDELDEREDVLRELLEEAGDEDLTLLYASRDTEQNNAAVLKERLEALARERPESF